MSLCTSTNIDRTGGLGGAGKPIVMNIIDHGVYVVIMDIVEQKLVKKPLKISMLIKRPMFKLTSQAKKV